MWLSIKRKKKDDMQTHTNILTYEKPASSCSMPRREEYRDIIMDLYNAGFLGSFKPGMVSVSLLEDAWYHRTLNEIMDDRVVRNTELHFLRENIKLPFKFRYGPGSDEIKFDEKKGSKILGKIKSQISIKKINPFSTDDYFESIGNILKSYGYILVE